MRAAALAVACLAALAAGCSSNDELSVSHVQRVAGRVEAPSVSQQTADLLAHVDFVSAEEGYVATEGGAILATKDGGRSWEGRTAVPRLAALDFVSLRHGVAVTHGGVLLETANGGRTWSLVHRMPPSRYGGYSGLSFADDGNGWIIGDSVYRTRDWGRTWTTASLPCGEYDGVIGPNFPDDRRGYLVCAGQPGAGSQGKTLYVTVDGGDSWAERSSATIGVARGGPGTLPASGYARQISFDPGGIGYLMEDRGGLFRSDTAGLTWKSLFYSEVLNDFSAPSASRIFAAFRSSLLRSDDAGRHWRRVFPAGFAEPFGRSIFFTQKRGIAFGVEEPLGAPQTVLATRDGGREWSLRGRVPLHGLVEQSFRFGSTVLATDGRSLVRSADQGKTWTRLRMPTGMYGWLSFVSPRLGFVAGGGRLLRTEDAGVHWQKVADKTRDLQGMVFVSSRDGFVVDYGPPAPDDGQKHPAPPERFLHSGDGGKTWKAFDLPFEHVVAIDALDSRHWWIFANTHCDLVRPCRSTEILRTSDGGAHWTLIRLPRTIDASETTFVTPSLGIAGSSSSGYEITHDGGVTWRLAS